jgi:SAM-dependent methyltransferase
MSNPWRSLPLDDYEGHMKSPEVGQLVVLADLFAEVLATRRPNSVAVLGVAGGNGLDRIDGEITKRVVGIDLNPVYLDVVRRRYSNLRGLELHCIDLAEQAANVEPVDLVHAALVFEHAGVDRCLDNALSLVATGGALSVVLQLPADAAPQVGTSAYPSMQSLKSHFSLIDPTWLRQTLEVRKFQMAYDAKRALPAGKAFWMGIFSPKLDGGVLLPATK